MWGFFPLFFRQLGHVSPLDVLCNRALWGCLVVGLILAVRRSWDKVGAALRRPGTLPRLTLAALLIGSNWLGFLWAVDQHLVIAGSLGYFLTPLVNVLLGMLVLKERLDGKEWIAVGLALAAVGNEFIALGSLPWVSLFLGGTFGFYGLVRKQVVVGPMVGLSVETMVLMPFGIAAMLYWGARGEVTFGVGIQHILLPLAGVITAIPLLLFATAARRLTLSTLGLLQYVGPSIQLLLGLFVYGEHLTLAHKIAFPLIWGALCLYSWGAMRQPKTSPA